MYICCKHNAHILYVRATGHSPIKANIEGDYTAVKDCNDNIGEGEVLGAEAYDLVKSEGEHTYAQDYNDNISEGKF